MRFTRNRIALILIVLLIAAPIFVWLAFSPRQRDSIVLALSRDMEGAPLPAFHVSNHDGDTSLFADLQTVEPSITVFWSPGCPYCHRMMDFIAEWDRRNGAASPVILVSFVSDFTISRKYLPEAAASWEQYAFASSDETSSLRSCGSMDIIPTLWLVDENGIIVRELHGFNILAVNRILKRSNGAGKPQLWLPFWMLNRPDRP